MRRSSAATAPHHDQEGLPEMRTEEGVKEKIAAEHEDMHEVRNLPRVEDLVLMSAFEATEVCREFSVEVLLFHGVDF